MLRLLGYFSTGTEGRGPQVLLLGDSMIERMQTTCKSASLRPWPAAAILRDAYLLEYTVLHKERLEGVFHAGVSGE